MWIVSLSIGSSAADLSLRLNCDFFLGRKGEDHDSLWGGRQPLGFLFPFGSFFYCQTLMQFLSMELRELLESN